MQVLPRGTAWLDTGTFDQMTDAAEVRAHHGASHRLEDRGVPEEIAWRQGFLTDDEIRVRATDAPSSDYGSYLLDLLERGR